MSGSPSNPLVGVVISAYQAERWLTTTLAAMQSQSWQNWVCVVVDDGSTDGTGAVAAEIAGSDSRITVLRQENKGVSAARNAALNALPCVDLIAFLDSDDLWLPATLQQLVEAVERRPDAVGAYGLAEYIDRDGKRMEVGRHPRQQRNRQRYVGGSWFGSLRAVASKDDLTFSEMIVNNPFWPPATGVLRAEPLKAAGYFDETYPVQEDWQLWLRVVQLGPFVALDAVVAEYRQHGANLTGNRSLNLRHQMRIRAEIWRSSTPEQARAVAGAWRRLLRFRLFHQLWLISRGVRDRDPILVYSAAAALALTMPQAFIKGPPSPGRAFDIARRFEDRADGRVRSRGR